MVGLSYQKVMSLCGRCVGVVLEGHSTGKLSIIDSRQARKKLSNKRKDEFISPRIKTNQIWNML